MSSMLDVIKQDFVAIKIAFERDSFEDMNIFCNRLMSNICFHETKNLVLVGFMLREIAIEFINIRRDKASLEAAKKVGNEFVTKMKKVLDDESFDVVDLWKIYCDYENNIRSFLMNPIEKEAYRKDTEIARNVMANLINILISNKDLLLEKNNILLKGMINEIGRIIIVHGTEPFPLLFFSLIKGLDRCHDYVLFSFTSHIELVDKESIKREVFPFIDRIATIKSVDLTSVPKDAYETASKILIDLIVEWRKYFMYHMDILRVVTEERKIEFSEEARKKISGIVAQALEKEVKGKK